MHFKKKYDNCFHARTSAEAYQMIPKTKTKRKQTRRNKIIVIINYLPLR